MARCPGKRWHQRFSQAIQAPWAWGGGVSLVPVIAGGRAPTHRTWAATGLGPFPDPGSLHMRRDRPSVSGHAPSPSERLSESVGAWPGEAWGSPAPLGNVGGWRPSLQTTPQTPRTQQPTEPPGQRKGTRTSRHLVGVPTMRPPHPHMTASGTVSPISLVPPTHGGLHPGAGGAQLSCHQ